MIEKVKKVLSVFEDIDVVEENGKLIISEKVNQVPELENFLKIYEPEENIVKRGNIYEVKTTIMSANKFRILIDNLFSDEYKTDVLDAYTLVIEPKSSQQKEEAQEIEKIKEEKVSLEDIAKMIDEKYKSLEIILFENEIEINTENVDEIAKEIDSIYPNINIIVEDKKIILKGE